MTIAQLLLPITDEERAAEEPKPKKIAARKASPIASDDEGRARCFEGPVVLKGSLLI